MIESSLSGKDSHAREVKPPIGLVEDLDFDIRSDDKGAETISDCLDCCDEVEEIDGVG